MKTTKKSSHQLLERENRFCISGKDGFPASISFKEDEVELLVDRLGKIYSLNNAIYIGTPAAISLRQSDRVLMTSLAHKVVHVNEKEVRLLANRNYFILLINDRWFYCRKGKFRCC